MSAIPSKWRIHGHKKFKCCVYCKEKVCTDEAYYSRTLKFETVSDRVIQYAHVHCVRERSKCEVKFRVS